MRQKAQEKSEKKLVFIRIVGILLGLVIFFSYILAGILAQYVQDDVMDSSARVIKFEPLTISDNNNIFTDPDTHKVLLAPGITIHRNTSVSFGGSEAACYVFLRVSATGFTKNDNYAYSYGSGTGKTIDFSISQDWTFLKEDSGTYVYYDILAPNEALTAQSVLQNGNITVGSYLTHSDLLALPTTLELSFDAYAVQLDGFGDYDTEAEHATVAWNSVKKYNLYI